jgi:hypothetical protein
MDTSQPSSRTSTTTHYAAGFGPETAQLAAAATASEGQADDTNAQTDSATDPAKAFEELTRAGGLLTADLATLLRRMKEASPEMVRAGTSEDIDRVNHAAHDLMDLHRMFAQLYRKWLVMRFGRDRAPDGMSV